MLSRARSSAKIKIDWMVFDLVNLSNLNDGEDDAMASKRTRPASPSRLARSTMASRVDFADLLRYRCGSEF